MTGADLLTNPIHLLASFLRLFGVTDSVDGVFHGLLKIGHEFGGDQRFFDSIHMSHFRYDSETVKPN